MLLDTDKNRNIDLLGKKVSIFYRTHIAVGHRNKGRARPPPAQVRRWLEAWISPYMQKKKNVQNWLKKLLEKVTICNRANTHILAECYMVYFVWVYYYSLDIRIMMKQFIYKNSIRLHFLPLLNSPLANKGETRCVNKKQDTSFLGMFSFPAYFLVATKRLYMSACPSVRPSDDK